MITLNGEKIIPTIFPDGTSQVWKIEQIRYNYTVQQNNFASVVWSFENEGEFLHLAQLKGLLDSYGYKTNLILDYLPYARQDKNELIECTSALNPFARLLNSLRFETILCMDPHSQVAQELIERLTPTYPFKQVQDAFKVTESYIVCYPDKGAREKYSKLYQTFPYIYGNKIRNQATGKIEGLEVIYNKGRDDLDCNGNLIVQNDILEKNILIVDDICDGGMTFIILAQKLLTLGAKEVNLFVTHGLFTKGLGPLRVSGIKRIFDKNGERF